VEFKMQTKALLAVSAFALLAGCATAGPAMPGLQAVERVTAPTPQTAESFAERGLYQQAAAAYGAALKTNAEDADARFGLAEVLFKAGKPEVAKVEFAKLLTNADWKLRGLEGIGRSSLATGDREGARDAFNQVVAEDTKAWKSWLGLAELYDLDKNWVKADEAYALALTSTTQPAIIYNNQGLSRLARGEASWAADHFRLALATDPTLTRAANNLEIAEAVLGKSIEKVSASERDARERARKLNNAGYVAMMQNRPEEARAFYQAAMETHPSFYPPAFQNLQTLDAAHPKVTSTEEAAH
jgi:Tfp pilus assembly protein PilF